MSLCGRGAVGTKTNIENAKTKHLSASGVLAEVCFCEGAVAVRVGLFNDVRRLGCS